MTAKLDVLVVVVLDGGDGVEVLADEVAQDSVAGAVEDADAAHSYERGIINEVHYGLDGLVTTHSADIDIGLEGQFAVVDVVVGLLAHVCGGAYLLNLYGLGGFQTVGLDRCGYLAECNGNVALVDRYHLTDLCLTGQTDGVTHLELALAGCYRYVEGL